MISIVEAAARGIERVRMEEWSNAFDHLKIDIVDTLPGPWLKLYSPMNKAVNGKDPVLFAWAVGPMKTDVHAKIFEPYNGPLPDSEEYKEEVEKWNETRDTQKA